MIYGCVFNFDRFLGYTGDYLPFSSNGKTVIDTYLRWVTYVELTFDLMQTLWFIFDIGIHKILIKFIIQVLIPVNLSTDFVRHIRECFNKYSKKLENSDWGKMTGCEFLPLYFFSLKTDFWVVKGLSHHSSWHAKTHMYLHCDRLKNRLWLIDSWKYSE